MTQTCIGCRNGDAFLTPISMAFQPIVNIRTRRVFAHEALVRGMANESAASILGSVDATNRYAFDQQCRVKAIELAANLFLPDEATRLSINFMPNAVYEPKACIKLTLATAMRTGFPINRIIFEFTEQEAINAGHVLNILRQYRDMGFMTAIDDFGSGYSGLNLLANFQPDIVKLDMELIRDIDQNPMKRTIVAHTLHMLKDMGIMPLCEGIETVGELTVLQDLGVELIQGYLIAKPCFEGVSAVTLPQMLGFAAH